MKIGDQVIQNHSIIHFVTPQIENLNSLSKSAIELEELINENELKMGIKMCEKKDL